MPAAPSPLSAPWSRTSAAGLAPLRGKRYLVFHDAYQYFERRFGLASAGAVTVAPDRPVGPRRVEMLRTAIAADRIACVFREPQFPPALIATLVEGSAARTGVLDPLGAELAPGPELYPALLRNPRRFARRLPCQIGLAG